MSRTANCIVVTIVWIAVCFLALIGVGVATRRTLVLLHPEAPKATKNPAAALDTHFAQRRTTTLVHILPGIAFMILGPLQFIRSLRTRYPRFHRWSGRIFLAASAVIGLTGLMLASGETIGGIDEQAAIFLFGNLFLFASAKAFWHALRREFAQHREWMIRGFAIGLAVATIRPIIGAFFAAAVLRGHTPQPSEFFGAAFWIGFTVQSIAAEIWIRYTRQTKAAIPSRASIEPAKAEFDSA